MTKKKRTYRALVIATLALLSATAIVTSVGNEPGEYALTRRVVNVPYEKALQEYVSRLENVRGVLSATYEEYDLIEKTALVTVTFDPEMTTAQIITVWFGNTSSIWEEHLMV